MTTLAMIFGMLPLAMAIGAGSEMRAPMARAVIGGLVTSTLLTLLVVPVVYSILDDFSAWINRVWAGKKPKEAQETPKERKSVVFRLLRAVGVAGVLALPILDTLMVMARRLWRGENPFLPDKTHLHHRLLEMGHSQSRAVLLMYAWTALIAGTGLALAFVPVPWALALFAVGLAALVVLVRRPVGKAAAARREALARDAG